MKIKIKDKEEIAQGTLRVDFDISGRKISFRPGQYIYITLLKPPYTDKKGRMRHFSIVSSPSEKNILTIATRIRDSAFKKSLVEMPLGTPVRLGIISGKFGLPRDPSRPVVGIAVGIGITPFISMLRYIKEENLDYKVTLLYSNRDRKSASFLEELENMSKTLPKFKLVLTMTNDPDWPGETRRIDGQFIRDYISDFQSCFYLISGPPPVVKALRNILRREFDIKRKHIEKDAFLGY